MAPSSHTMFLLTPGQGPQHLIYSALWAHKIVKHPFQDYLLLAVGCREVSVWSYSVAASILVGMHDVPSLIAT